MDKAAMYQKTASGAEAIATRNAALTPKQRSMLILINGKRGFEELARLGQGLGDPELLMAQLAQQGLIEAGAPAAGAPQNPAPQEAAVSLPEAKRFAVRRLHDLLGPTADDLCLRIESAGTSQEFRAAIRRTETVLREVVGAELAQQFATDVEGQRPGPRA